MTKNLHYPAIAVAVGAAILLSGCTFRIADPSDRPSMPPTATAPTPSKTADVDDSDDDVSGDDVSGTKDGSERDRLEDLVTVTLPCEPEIEVTQPGATLRLEGQCESVTVTGDASVVIADSIGSLVITASGVVVYADDISSLKVTGDANTVRWEGSTPSVDNTGAGNTLGKDN